MASFARNGPAQRSCEEGRFPLERVATDTFGFEPLNEGGKRCGRGMAVKSRFLLSRSNKTDRHVRGFQLSW